MAVPYCDNCYSPPGCCLCFADEEAVIVTIVRESEDLTCTVELTCGPDDDDDDGDFDSDLDLDGPARDPSKEPTDTIPSGDAPGGSD